MNVGSLFSGIGGLDLGLERAGMRVVWQCESDPYARAVLRKHWPTSRCFTDIRRLRRPPPVHVLAGGFPCQDISDIGNRAGLAGKQSGLWSHFRRLICALRPNYIVVENVAALRVRGLERVLSDLAAGGYDSEWDCIPAAALGAPHLRDRLFIVAYPSGAGVETERLSRPEGRHMGSDIDGRIASVFGQAPRKGIFWNSEPGMDRLVYGPPGELADALHAIGNAVVPQVAEYIGRLILAHAEGEMKAYAPKAPKDVP